MPVTSVKAPAKGVREWDIGSKRKKNRKVVTIMERAKN